MRKDRHPAYHLALVGVMAALVYVVTMFRFPLLGSKVHFANAMCLLAGLLLGGGYGGAAAGLGSALYDLLAGGYDPLQALITFVSKFAMAWVCAVWRLTAGGQRRAGKGLCSLLPGFGCLYCTVHAQKLCVQVICGTGACGYPGRGTPGETDSRAAQWRGGRAGYAPAGTGHVPGPTPRRGTGKISCGWLLGSAVYSSSRKIPRRRRYIFQKRKALPYPVHPGREGLFAYGMQETDGLYSHISRVWA